MQKNIEQIEKQFGQFTGDTFKKLDFPFVAGKNILDLGCGPGLDSLIFKNTFELDTYALDLYEHENIKDLKVKFMLGSIYQLPYENGFFDYVFMHDILHHIDEMGQRYSKHTEALRELKRVVKREGFVIIVEGNRYNPLFYPHMVKMLGHQHFSQKYFRKIVKEVFPSAKFQVFESHLYPKKWLWFWKFYETTMERYCPKPFLAYNVAIIRV